MAFYYFSITKTRNLESTNFILFVFRVFVLSRFRDEFFFSGFALFEQDVIKFKRSKIACQSVFSIQNDLTASGNPYISTAQIGLQSSVAWFKGSTFTRLR
jgi:hypothetical protein